MKEPIEDPATEIAGFSTLRPADQAYILSLIEKFVTEREMEKKKQMEKEEENQKKEEKQQCKDVQRDEVDEMGENQGINSNGGLLDVRYIFSSLYVQSRINNAIDNITLLTTRTAPLRGIRSGYRPPSAHHSLSLSVSLSPFPSLSRHFRCNEGPYDLHTIYTVPSTSACRRPCCHNLPCSRLLIARTQIVCISELSAACSFAQTVSFSFASGEYPLHNNPQYRLYYSVI
jgi:hypothetical protein